MDFKKCNRCGSFYVTEGDVCPKCNSKENFDIAKFKNYLEINGTENSINEMSVQTGISQKHLNRFLGYDEFKQYSKKLNDSKIGKINKV